MLPRVQASVAAAVRACLAARCLEWTRPECGDGDAVWVAWSLLRCGEVEPVARVPPAGGAWPAVEL